MATASAASCISTEHGCVMFDCLVHLWEWLDPPTFQTQYPMENNKIAPATQQPLTQQHLVAHHVHPDQIYSQHHHTSLSNLNSPQQSQIQPNGVMHQLLKSQYQSNLDARSPLLENRQHEIYGSGQNQDYAKNYGANDNYNYPQSPPRVERTEVQTDHNVNHELLQNIPKGYNAEVYQDYMKRNPPKDQHQIYQNHQLMYRSNANQYTPKPYLPFSNRIGPQSNTELLRRQYNEIQQMKLQQQIHYQNQAQMHQQQKFAERQLLLQQIHGVQPPPNLQNSIYSDGSYRDLDQYGSRNDFKEYSSPDIQKDIDRYIKNNEFKEIDKQKPNYEESHWLSNQPTDTRETSLHRKQSEGEKEKCQFSPTDFNNQKHNVGVISPMKSSESSSPGIRSPLEIRRSSSGNQAIRSPIAQRIPSAPVAMSGILYKQGSDGLKVWRKRWFVLSEYCLFYYKSQDEQKLLGSVLLPSYKVSGCTSEDKVLRKFSFKLEHANMRTYVLAAPDQEAMMKWVKALTMAALMQNYNEQQQKQSDRTAVKSEDEDEIPGPTYANAPPKPRRSNDGYNSPCSDIYDPNYDLLKKPASHYSQTIQNRHQEHNNYPNNPVQDHNIIYNTNVQSPPIQHQPQYQNKRSYDMHQLSLPLTNIVADRLVNNQQNPSAIYMPNNAQSPYFENRIQNQQSHTAQGNKQEQVYDSQQKRYSKISNPFLQNNMSPPEKKVNDQYGKTKISTDQHNISKLDETYAESHSLQKSNQDVIEYNKDVYGELNPKPSKVPLNERLLVERRTPDAYGRSTTMSNGKGKIGDYEDVYASYSNEDQYGQTYGKLPSSSQSRENINVSSHVHQSYPGTYSQEKTFSGPSVLRRRKMQSSGIQPPMPRPHSADFLEYESKQEMLNRNVTNRPVIATTKQPQRPKSSLDINSCYDPSSDRYYSEESYAEKMRQSALYLQQGLGPKNIQVPLAKYTSGLAEKQLHSPYSQFTNNNYETEFGGNKSSRDTISYNSKYSDAEGNSSNWTLKEKEDQKEHLNRSGSVMSNGSNISGYAKDTNKFEAPPDGFMRSASARLPTANEKDGEKKVQQREESMKRLLEWKQRMLQSPLTRKSTPATISLARSLNQSRQSLRSDQYKSKTYTNASYNSYSSDDEEETTGTDLHKPRNTQAGRSHSKKLISYNMLHSITPHAISTDVISDCSHVVKKETVNSENEYENITCSTQQSESIVEPTDNNQQDKSEIDHIKNEDLEPQKINDHNGYETHESEAESETQLEYTDDDLEEELLQSEAEITSTTVEIKDEFILTEKSEHKSETPPAHPSGEEHYLPMTPRKTSAIEPAHKSIIENLSVFIHSMSQFYEDNPYVEMNLGNNEDDMQTYEVVCVNNNKIEPVYMELNNVILNEKDSDKASSTNSALDVASDATKLKDDTLKRPSKNKDKTFKTNMNKNCDNSDCSDADDESSKDISLDSPYSRLSISDNFRPASYYLNCSKNISDISKRESSDSEISLSHTILNPSSSCEQLSVEALSKYILDKLEKSDIAQDNSILKMLTTENHKMNTAKRKTTSLMIYGSHTSINDTLSRGEKVRNNRANSASDRNKIKQFQSKNTIDSILETNAQRGESDSLSSYNADKESSRVSLESDVSSKFEITLSEIGSVNDSEHGIEFRNVIGYRNLDVLSKRRPFSDESLFSLVAPCTENSESIPNLDLDKYLDNLQPASMLVNINDNYESSCANIIENDRADIVPQAEKLNAFSHERSLSTPESSTSKMGCNGVHYENISESDTLGRCNRQSFPTNIRSPLSYYCKNSDKEKSNTKNLKNETVIEKIKEFESEKSVLKSEIDATASSIAIGFHSRDSSTEQSAPYYYSDLSSQEQINVVTTSHFLKNTNLHRKLNNQRRRGPIQKKNEISHIHNPIHNNKTFSRPLELVASARSVSVEFLTAAEKDSEIDIKNIYESTGGRSSKIPESMTLMSNLGFTLPSCNAKQMESVQDNSNNKTRNNLNACSLAKISTASMSSHCSGNSSNTVYYDAEGEVSTYENIVCQGEKHWDEDSLWRDNLRRVSHRHARSMDDLDTVPLENSIPDHTTVNICGTNSIQRVKKDTKLTRNATYVNCVVQNHFVKHVESKYSFQSACSEENESVGSNDVYVSLVEDAQKVIEQSDEGVYEQLALEPLQNAICNQLLQNEKRVVRENNKKRFEIDREKLRQWDLMSSGLMKGAVGCVRSTGAGLGTGDALCSTDSGADSASNEASMTISGVNIQPESNYTSQQQLAKKSFIGSNTSIGRNSRDATNIPVRAVSPRVRWVEDKTNDHYSSQHLSASQQNLHIQSTTEDIWSTTRSPSRISQQPIRAVSPRIRRNTENEEMRSADAQQLGHRQQVAEVPTAGELLGRTHEELVLLLIQLRRRHTATHRAIEQCCVQISSIEDCLSSLKAMEREENIQRLEQLKMQLMELEHQYEKSKPLVQLVDNMVKLGSLYNRPGSTVERLERNQRLRHKVLAEHAQEQQRWLESAAAGKPLETEAARARVAELWALEQELADEAAILQGLKTDKDTIETLLTGVRGKIDSLPRGDLTSSITSINAANSNNPMSSANELETELARVHAMLALNSKKLEQTVADNARLERELQHLRRALQAQRAAPTHHMQHQSGYPAHATAMLEDEVSRVQQLVSDLQRQRQELSRAVRHLTHQSQTLQTTQDSLPGKRRPMSSWQETNLDTGHTIDHGQLEYDYDTAPALAPPGHYAPNHMETPLYVETRSMVTDTISPLTSEDIQNSAFGNLSNVEKQEIKTVRIVKRESERRQRDRERCQPMSEWTSNNITANLDQFLEEEFAQPPNNNYNSRASSVPRPDFSKFEEYYTKPQTAEPPNYIRLNDKMSAMELSPKFPSSPSLSNYDYSRDISSLSSSYHKSYDRSGYEKSMSLSTQYLNSPTDSSRTLTNDPLSKTSSIGSLTRSHMELSPIFKSEAAKQIITEMSSDVPKNGSLHRRQVPKEKRRHNTAPHHLSAKTLNEMPKDAYNQDMGRSLDDADMERALRAPPDVVRSAIAPQRFADSTIDQLLAAPQKILIPERYIPEMPPELSPEEQQKRQEKVESIKKMLSSSSADTNKSPDKEEKRQREHLLQMNQILAKQVTEMSKIIAVKALEELPTPTEENLDDRSPDVELPIYQQRDNFFT